MSSAIVSIILASLLLNASLLYTNPTSAFPEVDQASTSFTSFAKTSFDDIESLIPSLVKTSSAYCPAGTLLGSPTAIFLTLSLVRSERPVIVVSLGPTKTKSFLTKSF